MTGSVHLKERDAVATLTFDNREKRNALGPPLIARIEDAMDELEARDDVRTVVLTGAGNQAFSAGFDISYYAEDAPEVDADEDGDFGEMVDRVKHFDYPTIAMINGGVYGGAMHLAAACDLRIAVDEARFGITPAKLGLIYPGEAIYEVMMHVGPAAVKEFLYTADFVAADRAYDMGFLNRVVPRDELEDTTYEMAETIAGNAPHSLVGTKKIVRALLDHGSLTETEAAWAQRLRDESEASDDHAEGVEAFMEGRDPEFSGE